MKRSIYTLFLCVCCFFVQSYCDEKRSLHLDQMELYNDFIKVLQDLETIAEQSLEKPKELLSCLKFHIKQLQVKRIDLNIKDREHVRDHGASEDECVKIKKQLRQLYAVKAALLRECRKINDGLRDIS